MLKPRQCPKWVYSVDLTKTFLFENKIDIFASCKVKTFSIEKIIFGAECQ